MPSPSRFCTLALFLALLYGFIAPSLSHAETDGSEEPSGETTVTETPEPPPAAKPAKRHAPTPKHKYFVADTQRVDAGIFHVAAVVGGNFYTEPAVSTLTGEATGNYYKDFGFQGGVAFDYDYSETADNIPLGLRGEILYKYVLSSTHVFALDAMARRMFRFSDQASFGLGAGASAALWYRAVTTTSPQEEILFMPSLILEAGFEFNPIMVDVKWLINRLGADSNLTGFELYFGIRL